MLRFDSERNKFFKIKRTKSMFTTAKETPSLLSLPNDVVINILARVPRRYHPILSCVSNKLRSLVCSSELQITRSLLGKDHFYVCFGESRTGYSSETSYHLFTFTENRPCLVSTPFSCPLAESYSAVFTMGPEIYFVCGKKRSMWILDSRSGKLRQGPSLLVASHEPGVGLVNEKIYIFGGICQKEDIQAQVFDLKTQTWQVAPNPSVKLECLNRSVATPSLGRKIYVMGGRDIIVYDTRDGKCDTIKPVEDHNTRQMCVVDNVIYMHIHDVGLVWYDSKEKEWRVVHGLKFKGYFNSIAMAEYKGKLAFLWHDLNKHEIWCTMIALCGSSKVAIRGQVEWSHRLLSHTPPDYYIKHFMVCIDY